ncbi:MAG TPA: 30S ribosomal protein S12 methylthiotransferase RimO [Acidobacteriota bacterium]|nr:30S ribosomal protein S12 methylthiotransferase RimO [Acidobacteriota bacterium]
MAKIGFISLGCPKNLVDSEVMIGLLQARGHILTADPSDADILIVNTCCFIEDSRKESIETILAAAQLKTSGSCKKLIVTGCLAERYASEIRSDLVEVDAILGTNQIEEIARAVDGIPVPPPNSYGRSDADLYLYDDKTPRTLIGPGYTAYIKIAEGCDHTCSFCIIPKIRGPIRSRTISSLVHEATQLADRGVKEITLVSQDTTSYGQDLGIQDGLAKLLKALNSIEGLRWIRFLYAYPNGISKKLIDVVNSNGKICKYIDMPLQHVSASVLKAMRRGGTKASLAQTIRRIKKGIPGVTLRTTMIVGFPGETREDFLELKKFCKEMEFDRLGVFAYSDEEDTAAFALQPKVPARTAEKRRRALMEQQAAIARRKNQELIGKEFTVLVEGPSEESELLLQGRLESQAPEIDGVCLINDSEAGELHSGEFRTIRITRALDHDLLGKVVR